MKKLLFGIVFVMIATFCVNAEAKVDVSDSGVYLSPFVGSSFAPGYGINTGCALGYQFWWGMRLEAVGSYRVMGYYDTPQVAAYALYDIMRSKVIYGTLGFGGGCAFYNYVVPTAGCRAGIGWNVFDGIFSVSVEYTGDMFWYYERQTPTYVNGFVASFRLLF